MQDDPLRPARPARKGGAVSPAERAELQRQGAKAAVRGEPAGTNPLDRPRNKPLATGDSAEQWRARSEAWDQGHKTQIQAQRSTGPAGGKSKADEHD